MGRGERGRVGERREGERISEEIAEKRTDEREQTKTQRLAIGNFWISKFNSSVCFP